MVIPWVGFPLARPAQAARADVAARSTSRSRRCSTRSRCPGQQRRRPRLAVRRGPAHRRGHAPARRSSRSACTARRCPTRTARRCGWSCPGSTASRASSRSSRSASPRSSRATTWNVAAPDEYGFYANVNPEVDHPRWSQATERRIGEFERRPTLPFNGYADQVAQPLRGHGPAPELLRRRRPRWRRARRAPRSPG